MSTADLHRSVAMVIHSVFLYAACTEDGYVKVGISRIPFERIYDIHNGSPSPVRAAQWVWIGSWSVARKIEKAIRKEWVTRHTRGEWYLFDYSKPEDKRDFHDTLNAVVEELARFRPEWKKLGPKDVKELIQAGENAHKPKYGKRTQRYGPMEPAPRR